MASRRGYDYSWSRPVPTDLAAAGAHFVCRYLSNDAGKNLTRAEADALTAAGIAIVCNWESTATRADDGGFTGGAQDARAALTQARACGIPDDRPIYFSVDQDTTVGVNISAYFKGVGSVLPLSRIGVYGSYAVVKGCLDAGLASWGWQTYAWSRGKWDDRAHIRQVQNGLRVAGADVDLNEAQTDDYGQTPAPTPPIRPDDQEFTMDKDAAAAFFALTKKVDDLAATVKEIGALVVHGDRTHYSLDKLQADITELKGKVGA